MTAAQHPRLIPAALALCASLLLGIGLAQAQTKLVSAEPTTNATVVAPKLIQLKFSGELAKALSSIKLADSGGNAIATMSMTAPDAKSLAIMPNAALAAGMYTVSWTAVSTDDGHRTTGSYRFTVK